MREDDGPVIGLEIHIQLGTRTKLFCSCPIDPSAEPNTLTCPVCLGHPGSLPVLNREAVKAGVMLGIALGAEIRRRTVFYRKNYFYPDLAKGYQITQHISQIAFGGEVKFQSNRERSVRITGIAIEEEAAKTVYTEDGFALLDFNRSGIPLLEVVTEPDLRSASEARGFLEALRLIVRYLGISEGDMERGHLRVDTNVSYVLDGVQGNRVEIKNINTFKAVEDAINYESERQKNLLLAGRPVPKETRAWDEHIGETLPMRMKEEASDYRFFPEPDLLHLVVDDALYEEAAEAVPELPEARLRRYVQDYGLAEQTARALISSRELSDYFDRVASLVKDKRRAGNFIAVDLVGIMRMRGESAEGLSVKPESLSELLLAVEDGSLPLSGAKIALVKALETGKPPVEVAKEEGLFSVSADEELLAWIEEVITSHPDEVDRFRKGKEGVLGFLVGQVMKRSGGRADPRRVREMMEKRIRG
ncbi:MAG: Asp-tRNA(Asn)/Glu-tRNA(Gln) amidotransferase subunit GatB [candidate division WOR-3 bacterium]